MAGNLIRNLLNAQLEAGQHTVSWDGTMNNGNPVAQGMYILHFQHGPVTEAVKIMKR